MRLRGLLVASALLVALGGVVYWSNKTHDPDAPKADPNASPKLLSLKEDQVQKVEIQKTAGESIALSKNASGTWEMTSPKPYRVDQDAMKSMLSTLASLDSERLIEEKAANWADYGLASPAMQVAVTEKGGKTHRILVGDDTPTGGAVFARIDGDPRVFTLASFTKSSFDKTPADLRDKRLLTFDAEKLSRLEVTAKGQTIEFGKTSQNDWQILKPRPLRADGGQVEELVRKLSDARMELSEDEKQAASKFASAAQVAVVRVTDASGAQELQVRRDREKNYYAKSSVAEGAFKVGSDLGEALDKGLEDYRNKKLFEFGWTDPAKVQVRDAGKTAVFEKSGEKWVSAGKQMDSASVQAVVDKLRDLQATKFVEQGFGAPEMEIDVTAGDGKRVEKVAIAKQGDRWLARRENEPTIYELDGAAVTELKKSIAEVKQAAPEKKS